MIQTFTFSGDTIHVNNEDPNKIIPQFLRARFKSNSTEISFQDVGHKTKERNNFCCENNMKVVFVYLESRSKRKLVTFL